MPIKIPKAFPRRKSSGNVLDELPNPPEPSFRVLERPNTRSFDGGQTFKRMSVGRPLSAGHFSGQESVEGQDTGNVNNRGSAGTNNSAASSGHDNYSASARHSSSSTLPSSTDAPLDDRSSSVSKDSRHLPAPPIPESTGYSLRAAGRAFSFGRKKADAQTYPGRPPIDHTESDGSIQSAATRTRALTESSYASGSTATPPKLLDAGLNFEPSEQDDLGSIFEHFGKRRSQLIDVGAPNHVRTASPEQIVPSGNVVRRPDDASNLLPAPLNVDRKRDSYPSPISQNSQHSQDELMASSSPMERTFSYEKDPPDGQLSNTCIVPLNSSTGTYNAMQQQQQQQQQQSRTKNTPRRNPSYGARDEQYRQSAHMDDDARLVLDSIAASRRLDHYSTNMHSDDEDDPATALVSRPGHRSFSPVTQRFSTMLEARQSSPSPHPESNQYKPAGSHGQVSTDTTPRAHNSSLDHHEERSLFDASPDIPGRKQLPKRPHLQPPARPQTQNKIMTPTEFERYRREQEMKSNENCQEKHDDSDDDDDIYEDEDEIERAKEAIRLRKKQEAHMSVYRQQMMKMTGEQPSELPSLRTGNESSITRSPHHPTGFSVPNFSFDRPPESGKTGDEDEDEDVPLGVLAAHGFPSKSRPPTITSSSSSKIQYKSESYPPPPGSTSGTPGAGRGSLPPFARHLPQDPYFGASIVNPSDRQSLAFGHQGPRSAHGGSQAGVPPGPPGGLVGVINAEERARAARRGSPNAQGGYSSPLPPSMLPGMPSMISPGEQQMSEQMNQMMQMQMQFMQQMQQMMGGGTMPMGMLPPGQQMPIMSPPSGMLQMSPHQQWMAHPGMAGPGMPSMQPMPPMPNQGLRPMSTGFHSAPSTPMSQPTQQRAMSMMAPGSNPPWPPKAAARQSKVPSMMSGALEAPMGASSYASSIAPSERSNVGMPSRYRPVSVALPDEQQDPRANSRASTIGSGTLMPSMHGGDNRSSTLSGDRAQSRLSSLRPVSTSPQPPKKVASDDDEEEGWEEMKRKRDQKKSKWRINRRRDTKPEADFEVYEYPEE